MRKPTCWECMQPFFIMQKWMLHRFSKPGGAELRSTCESYEEFWEPIICLVQGRNSRCISVVTRYLTWQEAYLCLTDDGLPDSLRAKYAHLIISNGILEFLRVYFTLFQASDVHGWYDYVLEKSTSWWGGVRWVIHIMVGGVGHEIHLMIGLGGIGWVMKSMVGWGVVGSWNPSDFLLWRSPLLGLPQ